MEKSTTIIKKNIRKILHLLLMLSHKSKYGQDFEECQINFFNQIKLLRVDNSNVLISTTSYYNNNKN